MTIKPEVTAAEAKSAERRALLKKAGRFAAVTAPAVTLILTATAKPKKALAVSVISSRQLKDTEGAADGATLLAILPGRGNGVAIDMIDGIGICLTEIKALAARVDSLKAS